MISCAGLRLLGEGAQEVQVRRFLGVELKGVFFLYLVNLVLVFYYEWACGPVGKGLENATILEDDFLTVFVLTFIHVCAYRLDL